MPSVLAPVRRPERFRTLTRGHAVIMAKRRKSSLRGPLADRQNIVVTF
ncbi:MAG: dihydrofolate reductase [Betaproteobacteria bacterium]|nr:dihydrofolate reductase [Betaproteobacteria bacterium]